MHVEPPCEQGVASTDRTCATLIGHFKGRVKRDVSHLPRLGVPLPRRWASDPLRITGVWQLIHFQV
jgi:hypothetical protein